ncbi:MAG: 23S rRNA (adenine(2503)-C(2))-methyltransferase RlmN [Oscillospiraceae bacterium]|nr:23S rRNA (adenine(2503)-C(2))-methyltransferase RlmN [Oscillospiraceae bacterium]MBQ7082639.1 23S rRNA (adenine(2503)-C(2))-methyltransferase RlmN [Oscillospiraceae bacterium]
MDKVDLKSMTLPKLEAYCASIGLPKFRAGQIFQWLHEKQVDSFDEMTNLSADLREKLKENCFISGISIRRKLVSQIDGTTKYLFEFADGETVESVLMQYKHGYSLCISTQVGCRMGCKFCASTLLGLARSLTPAEMLNEVYMAGKDSGHKISSIVLMGIGEPLDNFDNVMDFLDILSSPKGLNLSLRHVSLSTCGLVEGIYKLMEKKLQLTLSISLHAPNDEIRNQTMPINRKHPIEELLTACREYFRVTGRRISFEYALIEGVNDTPACAQELASRLRGMSAHVNLIPVNPVKERDYKKSSKERIRRFQEILEKHHINATVRRELGSDINAACGQLRRDDKGGGTC